MTATPYPLPRQTRESGINVGNGTVGPYGPSTYEIFDTADVKVWAKAAGEDVYNDVTDGCTIAKTNPANDAYDTFSVTFDAAVPDTTSWYHQARRTAERSVAVTKAGTLVSSELEKELSKQASAQSELRRDVDRAVRVPAGEDPVTIIPGENGELLKFEAGKVLGSGENVDTINGSTAAAAASATAARHSADSALAAQVAAEAAAGASLANAASRAAAIVTAFPGTITYVRTAGYATAGDGGGGLYKKVVAAPAHLGFFQSADGAYWELVDDFVVSVQFGGVIGNAITCALGRSFRLGPGETATVRVPEDAATVALALAGIRKWLPSTTSAIIISVADGIYNQAVSLVVDYAFGSFLQIASRSAIQPFAFSNLVSIVSNGVKDHSVTFALATVAGLAVNDYIRVSAVTGTGSVKSLEGYWKITAIAGLNVTFKVTDQHANMQVDGTGAALAITVTSASIDRMPVMLVFTPPILPAGEFFGVDVQVDFGSFAAGRSCLSGIGIITRTDRLATNGVRIANGVHAYAVGSFAVADCGRNGIWAFRNAQVYFDKITVSNCVSNGFYLLQNVSGELIRSIATGNNLGFVAATGSTIAASQATAAGNTIGMASSDGANIASDSGFVVGNTSIGARSELGAYVKLTNCSVANNLTGETAQSGGRVYESGNTFSGNTSDRSLALNTTKADGSLIFDGTGLAAPVSTVITSVTLLCTFGAIAANSFATLTFTSADNALIALIKAADEVSFAFTTAPSAYGITYRAACYVDGQLVLTAVNAETVARTPAARNVKFIVRRVQ